MTSQRRKLIEVALPLDAINQAAAREKSIRHGHPCTMHLWWSRKPLAVCRAILFAQIVDDPASHPERFPTEIEQATERARLFSIIGELVKWENTAGSKRAAYSAIMATARAEIARSAGEMPPAVLDTFSGGGSIPLEAQRLGLPATGSDLNPVAALLTQATVEFPARFAACRPVHPQAVTRFEQSWHGASGLAEDVRRYGSAMHTEARHRLSHLYPPAPDGRPIQAWLWARTVPCPNPACGATVPLVGNWDLAARRDSRAWIEPLVAREAATIRYAIRTGCGETPQPTIGRRGGRCPTCGGQIPFDYLRAVGGAGGLGLDLIAMVAAGGGPRYLAPDPAHAVGALATPVSEDMLDSLLPDQALGFRVQKYGMRRHRDLFAPRQLTLFTVLTDLVREMRAEILYDALAAGLVDDERSLADGGTGAAAYADAVATYLALAVDKLVDRHTALVPWDSGKGAMGHTFARAILPMIWTYTEANPFILPGAGLANAIEYLCEALEALPAMPNGKGAQEDALEPITGQDRYVVSTDPPYYDSIGYADLSDIFYVWLRRSLREIHPALFGTMLVPKAHEFIAVPARHGGDPVKARQFFESGLRRAFERLRRIQDPAFPLTLYYAFRQVEGYSDSADGTEQVASTGWEALLEALLGAEFTITGTWPVRTESSGRVRAHSSNALASSIVLVCRPRLADAPTISRSQFRRELRRELPTALRHLQQGNIAPVDLAQAAIGPGMAVYSRCAAVLEADGSPLRVRTALALINEMLDEVLAEQEGEFDADTRWALAWFDQYGVEQGPFGVAETLSTAKNTSVAGLVEAGFLEARSGKVRLLRRDELPENWNPSTDSRLTVWETAQHLIHALDKHGENGAAALLRAVGSSGEIARDLAYRLYTTCERKGWTQEALAYNSLVVAWPEISKLAAQAPEVTQLGMFV